MLDPQAWVVKAASGRPDALTPKLLGAQVGTGDIVSMLHGERGQRKRGHGRQRSLAVLVGTHMCIRAAGPPYPNAAFNPDLATSCGHTGILVLLSCAA